MSFRDEDDKALLVEFCEWFEGKKGIGDVNRKPVSNDVDRFLVERTEGTSTQYEAVK